MADLAQAAEPMQVRSYQSAEGDTYFAGSLGPATARFPEPTDVVVVVDTSASQTGAYRGVALAAVDAMLKSLDPEDRFCVVAADLEPRVLTAMTSASSEGQKRAAAALQTQTPLGSTDLKSSGSALLAFTRSGRI